MSGAKETPRQKMIGMMYLFLTAMLAMNVSKDVLNSFVLVNDSLSTTVENFTDKNEGIYHDFDQQASMNEEKVGKWRDLAYEVKKQADDINEYIKELKVEVVEAADGEGSPAITEDGDVMANDIDSKDNIDVGSEVMEVKGKGPKLKKKIEEFREFLIDNTDPSHTLIRNTIKKNLNTDDPPPEDGAPVSWTSHLFGHMPLAGVITMLTKMQSDIRNAEADIIKYFYRQISAQDFKFNKLDPVVTPKSNYILQGGKYEANVFIAAQDTTQDPSIYIGDYRKNEQGQYEMVGSYDSLDIENGKGIYKANANRPGERSWGGLIAMQAPDGSIQKYPFESEYKVAPPTAIISASANRVFYYGVANPLEVSVPMVRKENVKPSATNAQIERYQGGYAIKPDKRGGKVKISLSAKIDGSQKFIGSRTFSVKQIPTPTPRLRPFNNKSGASLTTDELAMSEGLEVVLEDFVMENINYEVTEFTIVVTDEAGFSRPIEINGSEFTAEAINKLQRLNRGQRLTIEKIKAEGPDGVKDIAPMVFTIE